MANTEPVGTDTIDNVLSWINAKRPIISRQQLIKERNAAGKHKGVGRGNKINWWRMLGWWFDLRVNLLDAEQAAPDFQNPQLADIYNRLADALEPREKIPLDKWAEANRIMTTPDPFPGAWDTSRTPAAREIMRAITDDLVKTVVVTTSPQYLKTELLINTCLYYLAHDASSILCLTASERLMDELSIRINRAVENCEALREQTPDKGNWTRSKEERDTAKVRTFKNGGQISIVNGNSKSAAISRPARLVVVDEWDEMANIKHLKDKLDDRVRAFGERSKLVFVSSPMPTTNSQIWALFRQGSQHIMYFKCPDCGELQEPQWKFVELVRRKARYRCQACDSLWDDNKRLKATAGGEYVAQALSPEQPDMSSFLVSGLTSPNQSLDQMWNKYVTAKKASEEGDWEGIAIFHTNQLGVPFDGQVGRINPETIRNYVEDYTPTSLPLEASIITLGCDVQNERLELELAAWGYDRAHERVRRWGISYHKIYGSYNEPATWKLLLPFFRSADRLKRVDGIAMVPKIVLIDSSSGFHTDRVYSFVLDCQDMIARTSPNPQAPRQLVFASKSSPWKQPEAIKLGSIRTDPRFPSFKRRMLMTVGSETCKTIIFNAMATPVTKDRPPPWVWPKNGEKYGYDDRYFRGFCSEECVSVFSKRARGSKWTREYHQVDKGINNEPIDTAMLNTAAIELFSIESLPIIQNAEQIQRELRGEKVKQPA